MSSINIFTLPSGASSAAEGSSGLRAEIEEGLLGGEQLIVPGQREEDRAWAYKRTVPTVVLYDEQGLRLYDKITAQAPEYYLFPDELNLLRTHGPEIARSMGFPGRRALAPEEVAEQLEQTKQERKSLEEDLLEPERTPEKEWKPARWGDADVGRWNGGVNGEEGLGGGVQRGYDVVELGAGALRKTAHLLIALADAVPAPSEGTAPITYLPLDLSHPELHRVLGEMDDGFGQKLNGKVECIGLHGDYLAGLQFIRDGKLPGLRESFRNQTSRNISRGLQLDTSSGRMRTEESAGSIEKDSSRGYSPPFSPTETHLATPPGFEIISPLRSAVSDPSTITEETDSDPGCQRTWSPPDQDVPPAPLSSNASAQINIDTSPEPTEQDRPLHIVFLGSSLGNFPREAAGPFLKSLPMSPGDTLLMGLDGRPAPGETGRKKVEVAYNDPAGHTKAFEEHGWEIVRRELGLQGDAGVEFVGRYNEVLGRHEAYFRSKAKQTISLPNAQKDVTLEDGELLNIEWSYKYSLTEALSLFEEADLRVVNSWKAPNSEYRLWLLERPKVLFSITPSVQGMTNSSSSPIEADTAQNMGHSYAFATATAAGKGADLAPPNQSVTKEYAGVPTWQQWQELWKLWDHITLEMIPKEMLHSKPIDLRHICLFYLGHMLTNGEHTHPVFFKDIFERGIDPDVDDPTRIHDHSEVPADVADWPSLEEILAFRDRVRERLHSIYDQLNNGTIKLTRRAGRVLFMTYEHEMMHAETLLYMLIQSSSTRSPTAGAAPQFNVLAKKWASEADTNVIIDVPASEVSLGHDDVEQDDKKHTSPDGWKNHEFGWDNENPKIQHTVAAFKVDALPVTNAEYLAFAKTTGLAFSDAGDELAPASWIHHDGEWKVRTLYGPVGFDVAGSWPLQASRNELNAFAKWKGGRLPTEMELWALWSHERGPRPAGKLANVGFKNWHPVPPQKTKLDNDGQILHGHNGGVWEWTSSVFDGHQGYIPSELYPGYSADFYDGKHYTVLGGSYATPPAIAGRKTFRNFFQGNYRFSFIGGRVAYD